MQTNRRNFLAGLSTAIPLSHLAQGAQSAAVSGSAGAPDYFRSLNVKPFINAIGPYSSLGGAIMWPEVIAAMDYAINNKARMVDLHDAVGQRIAQLTGAEAALVSSGATGAIILATAACMTMGDTTRMERLPDTRDMPNEVIILKGQRYLYDRSIRAPGAILVEAETVADVRAAYSDRTAMLFYLLNRPAESSIEEAEYIALAHELGVPILCDAATTVPPVSNMLDTVARGYDLVCYSGGKGLRGPYSAGLLLGRADLIAHARRNGSPNHRAYGRSMKVSAEEYLGMMVAVETSLSFDEAAEFNRQERAVVAMGRELEQLPGVETVVRIPDAEAREPYIEVHWDSATYSVSVAAVKQALREGEPSIEIRALFLSDNQLHLTAVALRQGEAELVTRRIAEILLEYRTGGSGA